MSRRGISSITKNMSTLDMNKRRREEDQEPTELDSLTNHEFARTIDCVLFLLASESPRRSPPPKYPTVVDRSVSTEILAERDPRRALLVSSENAKSIPLSKYVVRWLGHPQGFKSEAVMAVIYIERLIDRGLKVTKHNVHAVYATAMTLAMKWVQDWVECIDVQAGVGEFSVEQMVKMEARMLKCLDYRLHVRNEDYQEVERKIMYIAKNELYRMEKKKKNVSSLCSIL